MTGLGSPHDFIPPYADRPIGDRSETEPHLWCKDLRQLFPWLRGFGGGRRRTACMGALGASGGGYRRPILRQGRLDRTDPVSPTDPSDQLFPTTASGLHEYYR